MLGLDFIVAHHASWNWRTKSVDFKDWGKAGVSCHLIEEVSFARDTVTCCRLTVGDSACDGQLLHVDPYMLERGIELQGGIGLVDHGELIVLAENRTAQMILLPASTSCGIATTVEAQDIVDWDEDLRCYEVSCHVLGEEPVI